MLTFLRAPRWSCALWLGAALECVVPTAGHAQAVVVDEPGTALSYYRNSHATAIGCWADLCGLRKAGEGDRLLIGIAAVFAEFCECDRPGEPTAWHVTTGIEKLLETRGHRASIEERVRYTEAVDERADLDRYVDAIRADLPVILTFCYDPAARTGLQEASRRVSRCTSVVGIGLVQADGGTYLICHDGLPDGQAEPIEIDHADAREVGLPAEGPWAQQGTSLYKWDGAYTNLVLVFVGKPQPQ